MTINRFQQYRPGQYVSQYVPTKLDANLWGNVLQARQEGFDKASVADFERKVPHYYGDNADAKSVYDEFDKEVANIHETLRVDGASRKAMTELMKVRKKYQNRVQSGDIGAMASRKEDYDTKLKGINKLKAKDPLGYDVASAAWEQNRDTPLRNKDGTYNTSLGNTIAVQSPDEHKILKSITSTITENKFPLYGKDGEKILYDAVGSDGSIIDGMYMSVNGTVTKISEERARAIIRTGFYNTPEVSRFMAQAKSVGLDLTPEYDNLINAYISAKTHTKTTKTVSFKGNKAKGSGKTSSYDYVVGQGGGIYNEDAYEELSNNRDKLFKNYNTSINAYDEKITKLREKYNDENITPSNITSNNYNEFKQQFPDSPLTKEEFGALKNSQQSILNQLEEYKQLDDRFVRAELAANWDWDVSLGELQHIIGTDSNFWGSFFGGMRKGNPLIYDETDIFLKTMFRKFSENSTFGGRLKERLISVFESSEFMKSSSNPDLGYNIKETFLNILNSGKADTLLNLMNNYTNTMKDAIENTSVTSDALFASFDSNKKYEELVFDNTNAVGDASTGTTGIYTDLLDNIKGEDIIKKSLVSTASFDKNGDNIFRMTIETKAGTFIKNIVVKGSNVEIKQEVIDIIGKIIKDEKVSDEDKLAMLAPYYEAYGSYETKGKAERLLTTLVDTEEPVAIKDGSGRTIMKVAKKDNTFFTYYAKNGEMIDYDSDGIPLLPGSSTTGDTDYTFSSPSQIIEKLGMLLYKINYGETNN